MSLLLLVEALTLCYHKEVELWEAKRVDKVDQVDGGRIAEFKVVAVRHNSGHWLLINRQLLHTLLGRPHNKQLSPDTKRVHHNK